MPLSVRVALWRLAFCGRFAVRSVKYVKEEARWTERQTLTTVDGLSTSHLMTMTPVADGLLAVCRLAFVGVAA